MARKQPTALSDFDLALELFPRTHQVLRRNQHVRVFWAGLVRSAHVCRELEPHIWELHNPAMGPDRAKFHASAIESEEFLIWGDNFPVEIDYFGNPKP